MAVRDSGADAHRHAAEDIPDRAAVCVGRGVEATARVRTIARRVTLSLWTPVAMPRLPASMTPVLFPKGLSHNLSVKAS